MSSSGDISSITPGDASAARPASNLPIQLRLDRMHRITRPPVRDPTHASRRPSTARTPRGHRDATPRPATCVHFAYTRRHPFRISEEENRVIEIPIKIPRCHSLHRAAAPGITATSSSGIIGASTCGSIGASASGTFEPSAPGVIGASTTGSLDQHHLLL